MKVYPLIVSALIIFAAALNLGAVRKVKNAVNDNQTQPTGAKERLEEVKDGEKGAPSPSFQYYGKYDGKSNFLTASPVDNNKEEPVREKGIPDVGSPIPENLEEEDLFTAEDQEIEEGAAQEEEEKSEEDSWFEEEEDKIEEGQEEVPAELETTPENEDKDDEFYLD